MEKKINILKEWLEMNALAARMYGEEEEIDVWNKVIDKVNELF